MRISGRGIGLGPLGLALLPALSCCGNMGRPDCGQVAESARRLSEQRPIRITGIANVRETARTETELRCAGDATLADGGTAPLYFRVHIVNGEAEVAYQGTPYP